MTITLSQNEIVKYGKDALENYLASKRSVLLIGDMDDTNAVAQYVKSRVISHSPIHFVSHLSTTSEVELYLRQLEHQGGLLITWGYETLKPAHQQLICDHYDSDLFRLLGTSVYPVDLSCDPFYFWMHLPSAGVKPVPVAAPPRRVSHRDAWQDDDSFDGVRGSLMDMPSFRRNR